MQCSVAVLRVMDHFMVAGLAKPLDGGMKSPSVPMGIELYCKFGCPKSIQFWTAMVSSSHFLCLLSNEFQNENLLIKQKFGNVIFMSSRKKVLHVLLCISSWKVDYWGFAPILTWRIKRNGRSFGSTGVRVMEAVMKQHIMYWWNINLGEERSQLAGSKCIMIWFIIISKKQNMVK